MSSSKLGLAIFITIALSTLATMVRAESNQNIEGGLKNLFLNIKDHPMIKEKIIELIKKRINVGGLEMADAEEDLQLSIKQLIKNINSKDIEQLMDNKKDTKALRPFTGNRLDNHMKCESLKSGVEENLKGFGTQFRDALINHLKDRVLKAGSQDGVQKSDNELVSEEVEENLQFASIIIKKLIFDSIKKRVLKSGNESILGCYLPPQDRNPTPRYRYPTSRYCGMLLC